MYNGRFYRRRKYVPKSRRTGRKTVRRTTYPRQKFRFQKGLSRSIIPFTRERETYFHLSDLTGNTTAPFSNFTHTNDGGVVGQINIRLSDFPSSSDFTNLFRQYKLNYIKITLIPSANTVLPGEARDEGGPHSNNQVLIRTMLNRTGIAVGAGNTIAEWSQIQAKKQWVLARDKPTVITCKLSQLVPTANAADDNLVDSVVKPRYISTNFTSAVHYGLNIRFDSLNGNPLSQTDHIWPQFRIIAKCYFTCKRVA